MGCTKVVGWKYNEQGDPGAEIECGKDIWLHSAQGGGYCRACADATAAEGLDTFSKEDGEAYVKLTQGSASRPILHAIDYDGTFTRDPDYYRAVVALGRSRGHEYVMVTGRSDEGRWGADVRRDVRDLMPIVFAGGGWKRQAAKAAGYEVDIWEDDHPEYIAPQDPLKRSAMVSTTLANILDTKMGCVEKALPRRASGT